MLEEKKLRKQNYLKPPKAFSIYTAVSIEAEFYILNSSRLFQSHIKSFGTLSIPVWKEKRSQHSQPTWKAQIAPFYLAFHSEFRQCSRISSMDRRLNLVVLR